MLIDLIYHFGKFQLEVSAMLVKRYLSRSKESIKVQSIQQGISCRDWDKVRSDLRKSKCVQLARKKTLNGESNKDNTRKSTRSTLSENSRSSIAWKPSLSVEDDFDESNVEVHYRAIMPLIDACKNEAPYDVLKQLLDNDPSQIYDAHKDSKRTCLHIVFCSERLDLKTVKMFIEAWGEIIQQQDMFGRTPLHLACMNRTQVIDKQILDMFCYGGKEVFGILDNNGMTPFEVAELNHLITADVLACMKEYTQKGWGSHMPVSSSIKSIIFE